MPAWHGPSGLNGPGAGLCVSRTESARASFFFFFAIDSFRVVTHILKVSV